MALVLQDRVSVNSTGSGTGSLVLGSAYPGFRTFASCIPTGSIVYYTITNQAVGLENEWEVGYGTYTLSTNTLSRDVVYSSSNAGSLVNFTAGTNGLQVFITYPSEQAVFQQPDGVTEFNEGPISVVGANATPGTFSATLAQFTSNEPGFSQLYIENQSNDANASSDIVAYNNLGDGTNYFVDVGMASSTYNDATYPIFQANDAYLYNAGNTAGTGAAGDISRLLIGTSTANSNVVIFGGSVNVNAVITTFVASTKNVNFANNISVTSNVSANNISLTNFAYSAGNINAASNTTVLTTKAYVDGAVATGFIVHDAAVYATAAALPNSPTYNNGTSGVGATLTANTNTALVIDGVTLVSPTNNGIRVLVKNEVASQYNGIYVVTESGSGSAPWVLTRATDFDTYAAGNIATNAYVYITSGNTNIGSSWIFSQIGTVVVGTTPLHFELFSQPAAYTGTAPINVSGQIISLTGIVPVANGGTNLSSYTAGDTLYANATNTLTRRAIGASNTVLVSNGSVPDWGTVALGSASAVSGTLGPTNGGTGQNSYVLGDIVYANGTNTLAKLAGQTTTTQKFLSQTGNGTFSAAPVWDTIPAGSITGLGTMASQNANAVTITGGSINGTAIGNSAANTGSFTALTDSGNLTFTGTGNRITGDFSNATVANRVIFQSSTTNGNTSLEAIPNGTGNIASTGVSNNSSDPSNTSLLNLFIDSTTARLQSGVRGTGTYLPLTMFTGGSERIRITTNGGVAFGGSTNYGTSGQILVSAGDAPPTWSSTASGISVGTATNLAGGAAGSIPYQSGSGTTQMLATGTGVLVGGTTPAYTTAPTLTGTNFTSIPNSATTASSANGASTIVSRDASGNFAGNTITAVSFSGSAGSSFATASGKVGIGISNPTPYDGALVLQKSSTATSDPFSNGTAGILSFRDSSNTAGNSSSIFNYDSTGSNSYIRFVNVDQNRAGAIAFGTATSGAATFGERMRLTPAGDLGIGTGSPGEKLEVNGNIRMSAVPGTNTNAALPVLFQASTGTIDGGSSLTFNPGGDTLSVNGFAITSSTASGAGSLATFTCANGAGQYDFRAANDSLRFIAASSEAMRIDANRSLGVGTSSPANNSISIVRGAGVSASVEICANGATPGSTNSYTLLQGTAGDAYVYNRANQPLIFGTNNIERSRFSAAGGFSVGTTSDPGVGAINATGNITAFFSDQRLKTVSGKIENALDKVKSLSGVYYTMNDVAKSHGYDSDETQVGVLAQEVEAVLPEIVKPAPFDLDENNNSKSGENYKTVQYEKLVPLLIEAIKELEAQVAELKAK
jgi:hypothetical protein